MTSKPNPETVAEIRQKLGPELAALIGRVTEPAEANGASNAEIAIGVAHALSAAVITVATFAAERGREKPMARSIVRSIREKVEGMDFAESRRWADERQGSVCEADPKGDGE